MTAKARKISSLKRAVARRKRQVSEGPGCAPCSPKKPAPPQPQVSWRYDTDGGVSLRESLTRPGQFFV